MPTLEDSFVVVGENFNDIKDAFGHTSSNASTSAGKSPPGAFFDTRSEDDDDEFTLIFGDENPSNAYSKVSMVDVKIPITNGNDEAIDRQHHVGSSEVRGDRKELCATPGTDRQDIRGISKHSIPRRKSALSCSDPSYPRTQDTQCESTTPISYGSPIEDSDDEESDPINHILGTSDDILALPAECCTDSDGGDDRLPSGCKEIVLERRTTPMSMFDKVGLDPLGYCALHCLYIPISRYKSE